MGCVRTPVSSDVDFPMKPDRDIHPGRTRGATRRAYGGVNEAEQCVIYNSYK